MGVDSVPAPTSLPHLPTLQSTGDSLHTKGRAGSHQGPAPSAQEASALRHSPSPSWASPALPRLGSLLLTCHCLSQAGHTRGVCKGMHSRQGRVCRLCNTNIPKAGRSHSLWVTPHSSPLGAQCIAAMLQAGLGAPGSPCHAVSPSVLLRHLWCCSGTWQGHTWLCSPALRCFCRAPRDTGTALAWH